MIKAILFDWHGVLDETLLAGLLDQLSEESKIKVPEIRERLGKITRDYVLGNITGENFWSNVKEKLNVSHSQVKKVQNYINTIIYVKPLWKFLSKLKEKYTLGILSDATMEKVEVIRKEVDLSPFTVTFFSAEEHLDKAMPEFFDLAINKLEIKREEALFVDDSQKNIDFAGSLGLQTHLFKGTEGLRRVSEI